MTILVRCLPFKPFNGIAIDRQSRLKWDVDGLNEEAGF